MFINRHILLAIDVGRRSKVDEIMKIALENGVAHYLEPEDMGRMYADRFVDPDGYQLGIMWVDDSLIP